MSKLITKARAGVTLVELLVVILIVTILSVSMLPLLQPFVTEAQYAAEAIPVIGNIRTKIGVYQYDKGHMPYSTAADAILPEKDAATWRVADGNPDVYSNAYYTVASSDSAANVQDGDEKTGHFGKILDIDYQDLKGKRSRPTHYQYYVICTNVTAYVVGCFGDGEGLKAGTGYAVCELNFPRAQRKMIGTWKRYKPKSDDVGQLQFVTDSAATENCYVPTPALIRNNNVDGADIDANIIRNMTDNGWEF